MKNAFKFTYSLSEEDVLSIVSALPLVTVYGADSEFQQLLNANLCASAAKKLLSRSKDFSPNELRVMAAAVYAAREFLAGRLSVEVDSDLASDVRRHIFTYNHLYEVFSPVMDHALSGLDT